MDLVVVVSRVAKKSPPWHCPPQSIETETSDLNAWEYSISHSSEPRHDRLPTQDSATNRDMSTGTAQQARRYYALVAGASFCIGAGMELFMVRSTTAVCSSASIRRTGGGLLDWWTLSPAPPPVSLPRVSNQSPRQIKTGFYEKVTMIEAEERRERLLSQQDGVVD